jgi:transposase-like protein
MPKIRKIKLEDRKDMRGGGYSRRKFTTEEVESIRKEYATTTEKVTISGLARKYNVSQPLMYQLIKGTTYNEGDMGGIGGTGGYRRRRGSVYNYNQ